MQRSDLPFGSEFSPSQIVLSYVLELAKQHGGDCRAFEGAIQGAYFSENETSDYNKGKLANNTKLGMIAYGMPSRLVCKDEQEGSEQRAMLITLSTR